jgi:GNAT superfamily N-acetyltransferase
MTWMDGVGVKGDENVLSAGARRLVLRLVRSGKDHEPLLDLFERAHRETRFHYIPFSRDKARRLLRQVMAEDARHLVAVAEVGRKPEGFVFASVGEYFVGTDVIIATINVIYTSQALRGSLLGGRAATRLLKAVRNWCKGIGAQEILLHTTSGICAEKVGKAVLRMGFQRLGGAYLAKVF